MSKKGKRIDDGSPSPPNRSGNNPQPGRRSNPDKRFAQTSAHADLSKKDTGKKPFFFSRLSRFWRFAIISFLATMTVILVLLVVWDSMYTMVEGGIGTYEPPDVMLDDPDESGNVGTALPAKPRPTPRPTPEGINTRDKIYTFLIAGRRDGLTDTLMVATMDLDKNSIEVLSIPRDTVIREAARSMKKINGAYNSGGGGESGMSLLLHEVESIVGFMPKHFISVDMNGFVKLVDAVGPIRFNVPVDMKVSAEGINLKAGEQDLNGAKALQLMRYRGAGGGGTESNDYGRMQRQQMFLVAVAKKVLAPENLFKANELVDIANQHLFSSMTVPQMMAVADYVFKIPVDNISFHTIPTYSVRAPKELKGNYYEVVKAEEALALINSTINPFNMDITTDMVDYMKLTER